MRCRWMLVTLLLMLGSRAAWAEQGEAVLRATADGSSVAGTATFLETEAGLDVRIELMQTPAGLHGLHIHQYGSCAEGGGAAGGHYNPDQVPHGFLPKNGFSGAHAGDLGNIEIGPDGTGQLELTLSGLGLGNGRYRVAGRAVILHEKSDDFGQPTGNAGGRIGCGTIVITGE